MINKYWLKLVIYTISIIVAIFFATYYFGGFSAPSADKTEERFIVSKETSEALNVNIIKKLKKEGFINSEWAFNFALNLKKFGYQIKPGAFKISRSMTAWQMADIFINEPYMKWVTIPEGLRKEEIAEIINKELGWGEEKTNKWLAEDTSKPSDYFEGVYFPDTYLIPIKESGSEIAKRLRSKFDEKYSEFAKEAFKQNIKWTTVVKLASIVQREAANKNDMALISGILWNRLEKGMKLEVDATVQYIKGETENGWWSAIKPEDKKIDSPYNTYMYKGLPPHPICNPGIEAIRSVIYPETTECIFYLHDPLGNIHCAKNYNEHLENIKEFLR